MPANVLMSPESFSYGPVCECVLKGRDCVQVPLCRNLDRECAYTYLELFLPLFFLLSQTRLFPFPCEPLQEGAEMQE